MYKAKDGRQFDHRGMGQAWDRNLAAKSGGGQSAKLGERAPREEADGEDDGASAEDVVAAHGPARETRIEKRDGSGGYSVHSKHEDGHERHSHGHESVEEAHEHSKALHGGGADDEDEDRGEEQDEDGAGFDDNSGDDGGY